MTYVYEDILGFLMLSGNQQVISGYLTVSTQINHPVSSTHLATAFISTLQYSNTGKATFDYSAYQKL